MPTNPAPVSGPGALSRRTDGGPQAIRDLPNAGYGENAEFRALQQGAPLPRAAAPSGGGGGAADPLAAVTGLGAPSQMPDTPVTDGASAGPGMGADVLGLPQSPSQERQADASDLHPGMVEALLRASTRPDASASFKRLVRTVLANR